MCWRFNRDDYKYNFHHISDKYCGCYSITKYYTNNLNKKHENEFWIFGPSETIYDYKCLEHNYELKRLKKRLAK